MNWQYQTITSATALSDAMLNFEGAGSWELVAITREFQRGKDRVRLSVDHAFASSRRQLLPGEFRFVYTFKRPLPAA